jgi:hypothetical protein
VGGWTTRLTKEEHHEIAWGWWKQRGEMGGVCSIMEPITEASEDLKDLDNSEDQGVHGRIISERILKI